MDSGYWLMQSESGDKLGFNLGFKEGRVVSVEETNNYLNKTGFGGEPYMVETGGKVKERYLEEGEVFYVVEYYNGGKPSPGGWGSKDKIATIKELREKLAVSQKWKNELDDDLVIREYRVKNGAKIRVREGTVGPQTESFKGPMEGQTLPGGGHQFELIDNLRGKAYRDFTEVLDDEGEKLL